MDDDINKKSSHAEREEKILKYWQDKDIFRKSVNNPASLTKEGDIKDYTFYDGPPFATGLPHYGHILPGTIKDVIPRYKTMRGFRVKRRWGWDCHGLPVENLVEKELNLKTKKDIIDFGIAKFNHEAKNSVMLYADEWREIIPRLGRWVDMDDDYRTMDATYTETVWWIFKKLHDKGLIYEGFKSMNLCPRCETTLSNFEVAQGYKDITDISVYAKFKLKGQNNTYLVAWTTTPWTLPGNVALAINPGIEYVKVKDTENSVEIFYILAKERYEAKKDIWIKDKVLNNPQILETIKGHKLIGLGYEPLFDYYAKDNKLKNRENGWKIYGADFVTTTDGTGIVHIAPAFGSDDYELLKKHNLPFVQHVNVDGTFRAEVGDFAGLHVKPKDTNEDRYYHQSTDILIIKWLSHHGQLLEKEKLIHSYPHCWRCETPLLNYASSSWFVKVTDLREKLVKENKKIVWVPQEIGTYRFGNWIKDGPDWAISRSRFWGAPIPVWREEDTKRTVVIGSLADLKKYSKSKNTYYIVRHGEAENNVQGILSSDPKTVHHLTEKGKKQVDMAVKNLKGIKFDKIFVSPFLRTQETMGILKNKLSWKDNIIETVADIGEINTGVYNGKKVSDLAKDFPLVSRFENMPEGAEKYGDIKKRMVNFLYGLESKYEGKNILIISHETPLFLLISAIDGLNKEQTIKLRGEKEYINNAEVRKLDFCPLPLNTDFELDLHRPFIDNLILRGDKGHKLQRVPDVFDCWFESGSMPYGSNHYPFESVDFEPKAGLLNKSKSYPADFIAEGLDQTRGWFYSMIVLGVALFGKAPFKKVIVNGMVLAEDGQKMSKSKKNYPDIMDIVNKFGADALRFYLMSSSAVRAQDLCFAEREVDEVVKKIVNRLMNMLVFYEMYACDFKQQNIPSTNVLDIWVMERLNEVTMQVTDSLENGELDKASRPFFDLVEDLSTWYLRRSRDRFKSEEEKSGAIATTRHVLIETAKLLAPFMPFLSEEIYMRLSGPKESVHLEPWPVPKKTDKNILEKMNLVRELSTKALEARMNAKINVRQPLALLKIRETKGKLDESYIQVLKEEINVKKVSFDSHITLEIELDTNVTVELKDEGMVRELLRAVQDLRKEKGLTIRDKAILKVEADVAGKNFVDKHQDIIGKSAMIERVVFENIPDGKVVKIDHLEVKIGM